MKQYSLESEERHPWKSNIVRLHKNILYEDVSITTMLQQQQQVSVSVY